jgi:UDP-N-acetylglucosamine--N-acetylmuramyl-(pentapeptide) pyrophosphoryl-undecaprenol N-acetylglucosamine transferase
MTKNYLVSTGGSGGHVLPATVLYEHLSEEANIIISTDKRGLKYLDKNKYQIEIIDTPKLNNIFILPLNLFVIFILTIKSFFLLKKKKIGKVFSTGGYMSLPLILASKILGLEIFLIEPNHILGRANKFFLDSCKKIFCYNGEIKNFPEKFKNKIIIIDPLVKRQIYELKFIKKNSEKFTILIVGGSQGANIFDKDLKNSILKISKNSSIRIIQQTYDSNISILKDFYSKNNLDNNIFSFDINFGDILQQADLCITRAGASTLAELSVINIPFIAIPLPTSKDNHQFENANFYKNNNCCWIIEQKYFEDEIEKLLINILNDKREYLKKKENLKKLNNKNTWKNVNQKILRVINENRVS